ncbi:hypothetical protein KIN20_024857, partial [Parelaphostrongylus tenuis]
MKAYENYYASPQPTFSRVLVGPSTSPQRRRRCTDCYRKFVKAGQCAWAQKRPKKSSQGVASVR